MRNREPSGPPRHRPDDQEAVEGDDETGHDDGRHGGRAAIDERAHDVRAPREQHERHEREGDPEGQGYLADDQRARRVEHDREHDQRRDHRHQATQGDRDRARGRRQGRAQQGERATGAGRGCGRVADG
jgi:hypothetical protein